MGALKGWRTDTRPNDRQLRDYCGTEHVCDFDKIQITNGRRGRQKSYTFLSTDTDSFRIFLRGTQVRGNYKTAKIWRRGNKSPIRGKIVVMPLETWVMYDEYIFFKARESFCDA